MKPLETVAVIGNGIIGHGIAQVFAMGQASDDWARRGFRSAARWTRSASASLTSRATG
jgi:3-hydroxyacyl-CoA dehydrogenase